MAFLAMALGTFDFILFGTMLPVVQEDFGWSEAYASGVATSIAIGTTLAVFLIGPITDRLGRRKGMLLTVSATALASAATAATMNVAYLIGVRSVGGVAVGEQAVNTAYLNEIYALSEDKAITKRRGFIYGIVQSGWPMGTFLAAAFAAVLLPFFDWRIVFLIATFPAILVLLARRKLKETPQFLIQRKLQDLRRAGDEEAAAALSDEYGIVNEKKVPLKQIFSRQNRRNTVVLSIAQCMSWFGIQTFSVLGTSVLTNGLNINFADALLMFIVINLVGAAGYVFHGWAGDRFGRRNVVVTAWLLCAFFFSAMLLAPVGPAGIVILYALGMFFLIGPHAAFVFYMGEAYDASCRSTGASFITAAGQPGAVISSALITVLLVAGYDWSTVALWIGAGGILISGLIMLLSQGVETLDIHTVRHAPMSP